MGNKYRERRRRVQAERASQQAIVQAQQIPDEPPGPPQSLAMRLMPLWISLALCYLVAIPYAQTAGHKFLVCDDNVYIFENPYVRQGLTWEGVKWAFRDPHAGNWHPLTWMSHMIDWQLFRQKLPADQEMKQEDGSWAGGHHLVSAAIHALSAVLLFLALRMMTRTLWPSAMVAALFAIHPLRVESVAWAAERKDVLSCFFWMLTMLAYAWYVKRATVPKWLRGLAGGDGANEKLLALGVKQSKYLMVIVFYALGLLSKSMLVTLPCVLFLLDIWPLHRLRVWPLPEPPSTPGRHAHRGVSPWLLILEKVPFFALAYYDAQITVEGQIRGVALNSAEALPYSARILNALISYVAYIGQTFWPRNLSIFYPHQYMLPEGIDGTFRAQAYACGLLLLAITALAVWLLFRRRPRSWFAVGWFWYLGTLVPVIGIIQVGIQARADRYTYIPSVGLYLMIVWAARAIARRWEQTRPVFLVLAPAVLVALTATTFVQVRHWHDNKPLFEHAIQVTDKNYFAWNHLGLDYDAKKDYKEAARCYSEALKIKSNYDFANNNLGVCYARFGETEKAEAKFLYATQINGTYADALSNIGVLYTMNGKPRDAIDFCERACRARGDNRASDIRNLARAHEMVDEPDHTEKAIEFYKMALSIDREETSSSIGLASCYIKQKHYDEALQVYGNALSYAPSNLELLIRKAKLLKLMNRVDDAIKAYEEVLEKTVNIPARIDPLNDLAALHAAKGDTAKAAACQQMVQQIVQAVNQEIAKAIAKTEEDLRKDPASVDLHQTLGMLYAQGGDAVRAKLQFEEVLRLAPDHSGAKQGLKVLEGKPATRMR